MPNFKLTDWTKVFPLQASHLQEPVEALRPLMTLLGGKGITSAQTQHGTTFTITVPDNILGFFLGYTVGTGPDGQADWPDARYFVNPALIDIQDSTADKGVNGKIRLGPFPPPKDDAGVFTTTYPITATNVGELPKPGLGDGGGTHSLPAGTPVLVMEMVDLQDPPSIHYLMVPTGGGAVSETAPEFQLMIRTGSDNVAYWAFGTAVPQLP